jgi:hypothetical protein
MDVESHPPASVLCLIWGDNLQRDRVTDSRGYLLDSSGLSQILFGNSVGKNSLPLILCNNLMGGFEQFFNLQAIIG